MATLTELVKTVAKVEGMDPATVGLFARAVREAGLIATRGRGASAAKMDFMDAANLLIAVNASDMARDAPITVRTYRRLEVDNKILDPRPKFGEALDQLLEATVNGSFPDDYLSHPSPPKIMQKFREGQVELEITFYNPLPRALIVIGVSGETSVALGNLYHDVPEKVMKDVDEIRLDFVLPKVRGSKKLLGDRRNTISIGNSTIRAVADILRQK
jgi:hypothetical protein